MYFNCNNPALAARFNQPCYESGTHSQKRDGKNMPTAHKKTD